MAMTFGEASNIRNAIQLWIDDVQLNIIPVLYGEYTLEAILRGRTHLVKDGTYESMQALETWAKQIPGRK
mgnify:CR=1 FL=1